MDIAALGKEPVRPDSPAGSDARYDPEFEELQAEMDKLSSPTASSGGVNWDRVSALCQSILSGKAKDILVASYLAVAQIQLRQLEGFAAGLKVYRDLLETFWESLFPPKKRIKGRIAAIEWWLEKSEAAMEKVHLEPQPGETLEQLRHDLKAIQAVLDEQLQEPPLLRPLERIIERLPAREDEPRAEAPPPPKEGQPPEPEKPASPSPPEPEAKPREKPAPHHGQEPGAAEPALKDQAGRIRSTVDAEKVSANAFKAIRQIADTLTSLEPADARPYRWRRIAGWAMIQTPPPEADGTTEIPPPPEYSFMLNSLCDHREKGSWKALLQLAEERLATAVLWLDLNRYAVEALEGLGERYREAREAVCQETACFVHRLPGIAEMAYADGTPFADPQTRQWIKEIQPAKEPGQPQSAIATNSQGQGELEETFQEAQALAQQHKLPDGVRVIQQKLQACSAGKDRLVWRIVLVRMLLGSSSDLASPHLELILQDIDRYRLEEWDPGVALEGLTAVFQGLKSGQGQDLPHEILTRIARLDPYQALQLGG